MHHLSTVDLIDRTGLAQVLTRSCPVQCTNCSPSDYLGSFSHDASLLIYMFRTARAIPADVSKSQQDPVAVDRASSFLPLLESTPWLHHTRSSGGKEGGRATACESGRVLHSTGLNEHLHQPVRTSGNKFCNLGNGSTDVIRPRSLFPPQRREPFVCPMSSLFHDV